MDHPLALLVGDPPATWEELGFVVADGVAWAGGVALVLGGELKGIRAWSLENLDGIPSIESPPMPRTALGPHPNGVVSLDHVVLATPDLERTIDRLEASGFDLRRRRDAGDTYQRPLQQAFFRVGPTILEVIGTPGRVEKGVPRFFGLAFTVADLEATADFFGDRLHPAKDAVQPGRRIATLDRGAGSTVAIAFMSAEPDVETPS
jgi:catechol 2,3-dioxygenase-like lactoylglutathione lyase family enzyme